MRSIGLLVTLFVACPVLAQNWYVPDSDPTLGTCNVIPFGSTVGGSFYNVKYQTRCTAADLGGAVNLITGLGFASCNTGRSHFDSLEIVIDHIPASQPLVTTFASNLTAAAVTVLSSTNYTWNVTANAWNEIGLQQLFVYNGVDDIVVQITTVNGIAPAGFHRGTRERIYWASSSGTPPASGTSGNAAGKIEVSMLTGKLSSHGDGCPGSNGTPLLTMQGTGQVSTTVSFDLTNGVQGGIALFIAGTTNGGPFPFDLSVLGAPGCFAYTDLGITNVVLLDGVGAGSVVLPIPAGAAGVLLYAQYAVLDVPANAFGFTSSNYGRLHAGN
jgi:hypothetical protein